ncbi:MAG: ribokinase [Cyanobacteriota bacterium]|nr:ribokinase [Cyanobacteriota bacterium]
MSVVIFGSINMDLAIATPRLPLPGETITGSNFLSAPGGKGANQAVAASRLGVNTQMVGRVGADGFGEKLLESLATAGVETRGVSISDRSSSGIAVIAVGGSGENSIIVVPGANGDIDETDSDRLKDLLPGKTALLLQLEIPLEAVISAAKAAKEIGVKVILDPAPFREDIPADLYKLIDIITPNEIEASQLVGFRVNNPETAKKAAQELRRRGVEVAIVKLGARGVICVCENQTLFIPGFPVDAVDTVAAGDAFNGGLAAAIDRGLSLREAVKWGAAAGALCATKSGAQSAMPDKETFEDFLSKLG